MTSHVITKEDGSSVQALYYYPYGEMQSNIGIDVARYKFTGQEWDAETDLYYYGARYYDPKLARFISADTIVPEPFYPQSLNRYAYCVNNPIILRDLDGHDWDSFTNWASDTWNTFSNWVSSGWDSLTNWASSGGGGYNMNFQSNDNSMPSVSSLAPNSYSSNSASSVSINGGGGASMTSVIGGGGGAGAGGGMYVDYPLLSIPFSERPTILLADWEYSQSTGQITYIDNQTGDRTPIGQGYSGNGPGLNNSAMQDVPFVGPIPQGTWTIGPQQNHTTGTGNLPDSMRLTPQDGTNTFDRNRFLIHGDNRRGNQSASEGCIILDRNIRNRIGNSGDNVLRVGP